MIVVTTPTGNIGGKVLQGLIEADEKVRVVVRDARRLSPELLAQVEVVEGSHGDDGVMSRACHGADRLFLVVPPSMDYADVGDYYRGFAEAARRAVWERGVARVVYVSGTGLGREKEAGAVAASFLAEEILANSGGAALRILHCGSFMENLIHSAAPSIRATGSFSTSVPGDVRIPWVATRDIAAAAVGLLTTDDSWTGKEDSSVGVLGPEDLTYDEIAAIIAKVAGRPVSYETNSAEAVIERTKGFGASEAAARGLAEIYDSMTNGTFNMIERTPENSSPTRFRDWCAEVLAPLIAE